MDDLKLYELPIEGVIKTKNDIFFGTANLIIKTDTDLNDLDVMSYLSYEEGVISPHHYKLVGKYGNRLLFIPGWGDYIIDYDIETEKRNYVKVNCPEMIMDGILDGKNIKFRSGIIIDDNLWLLPQSAHRIIKYSLSNSGITEYTEWFDKISNYPAGESLFGLALFKKGRIIFPCNWNNNIIVFNVSNGDTEVVEVGDKQTRIGAMSCLGEVLIIADGKNRKIFELRQDGTIKMLFGENDFPKDYGVSLEFEHNEANERIVISEIIPFNDHLIGVAGSGNMFLDIDIHRGRIKPICEKPEYSGYMSHITDENDNKVIVFDQNKNNEIIINGNMESKIVNLFIDEKKPTVEAGWYLASLLEGRNNCKERIYYEANNVSLEAYMYAITC